MVHLQFHGISEHVSDELADGKQKLRSSRLGRETFLTAIAAHDRTVYLADAGNREV